MLNNLAICLNLMQNKSPGSASAGRLCSILHWNSKLHPLWIWNLFSRLGKQESCGQTLDLMFSYLCILHIYTSVLDGDRDFLFVADHESSIGRGSALWTSQDGTRKNKEFLPLAQKTAFFRQIATIWIITRPTRTIGCNSSAYSFLPLDSTPTPFSLLQRLSTLLGLWKRVYLHVNF